MKITKTPDGWNIVPSTSRELDHLTFLLDALRERYGKVSELAAETPASARSRNCLTDKSRYDREVAAGKPSVWLNRDGRQ